MRMRPRWALAGCVLLVTVALLLLLPLTATAADRPNTECAGCHGESSMVSNAFFHVGTVDRNIVCSKCHLDSLFGSHPYHYGGGNCVVCHNGYGASISAAVPSVLTLQGSFAATSSPASPSYVLHAIHSTPRWVSDLKTADATCASCHETAACDACHTGAPVPDATTHAGHADTAMGYNASSTVITPWVGDIAYGIVADMTEDSVVRGASVRCGAAGCHDTNLTSSMTPSLMDSFTHGTLVGGYIPTTVTKVGTWTTVKTTAYSQSQELLTNVSGASVSVVFNAQRVTVVSDTDPYRGIMQISIDGAPVAEVDQYTSTTKYQQQVWTSGDLGAGPHTITMRPTGRKNAAARGTWITFDQLRVFTAASDSIAPNCVRCHVAENDPAHGGTAAAHDLSTTGSVYNNTIQTGCLDAGFGCHGATVTSYASSQYHPANGCVLGTCHSASNHNDAAFDNPNSCVDCHTGAYDQAPNVASGVLSASHYNETTHTASGMSATVSAGGTYSAACSTCHNPVNATGPDGLYNQHLGLTGFGSLTCAECHNASDGTIAIVTDDVAQTTCVACHTNAVLPGLPQHASTATTVTGTEAQGAGTCKTTGCHTTLDIHALHKSNTAGAENGCTMTGCHDATKQGVKPTSKSCGTGGACHNTGSPHPGEAAAHMTLASTNCVVCHDSADLKIVHGFTCAKCHGNASYPTLPTGKLECTSCHNGTDVGLHLYDPTDPNHYDETTHTATPFTAAAQGTGIDGTVAAEGKECSTCHAPSMKLAHATTSIGAVSCSGCHTNLSLNSSSTVAANWPNDRCTDCHDYGTATTHDAYATTHVVAAGVCAGTGASCHNYTDIAKLHDKSWSGGAPKYQSCSSANSIGNADATSCHVTDNVRPTRWASNANPCGSTAGCHTEKTPTNHGGDHGYAGTSDYTQSPDTPGSEAGCAASGSGCHGTVGTRDAVLEFHASKTTGCTSTDKCHGSPTMDAAWKAAGSGADCSRCHNNNFVNAKDTMPLYGAASSGHYNETTHTASNMTTSVAAGGSASATCAGCHSSGYRDAHGAVGSFSSTTWGTYLTCRECHGYNAAVSTLITDTARTNNCANCHTAAVLGASHAVHSTTAPVVNVGTGTNCASTGIGCHANGNLHALHKNAASCALNGCHDGLNKSLTAASTSCGQASGCHLSSAYTPTKHQGPRGLVNGADTTHTAGAVQMSSTTVGSTACSVCHADALNTEHTRASSAMTGAGATSCTQCHNDSAAVASVVTSSWPQKNRTDACSICHDGSSAATLHGSMATSHTAIAVTGCTQKGAGCHGTEATPDIPTVHNNKCSIAGCHSTTAVASQRSCVGTGCHASGYSTTTYAHNAVNGSDATHTVTGGSMTTTSSSGGTYSAACSACHSSTLKLAHSITSATASLGWADECTGCHNATSPINVAALVAANGTWADTCVGNGCHTTGQSAHVDGGADVVAVTGTETVAGSCVTTGCHATTDLHDLHKSNVAGAANACSMSGCHDAAHVDTRPTAKSCGTGGACHNSAPIHPTEATKHTTLASGACVVCHESADLKLVHGDACGTCHGNATYPTLPTGKLECTSCHNATLVGTHVYDPTDPNHYLVVNHTADGVEAGIANTDGNTCDTCHSLEMKPEHFKSSTNTSTLSAYGNTCIGCHEVKVDAFGVTPWSKDCQACHAVATVHGDYAAKHDFTTGNAACAGANCHDITDVATMHNAGLAQPLAGDCSVSCHVTNTAVPTAKTCVTCHAAHPASATVHASADTECTECHDDKNDISIGHATCATCHADPRLTNYLQYSYTSTCIDCHNATLIGGMQYSTPDPNHYNVTTHTASPFTAAYQGTGADGAVAAEGKECSLCHTPTLKLTHASTSVGVPLECVDCHKDTSLNSSATVAANWPNNRCTDCHDYGTAQTHDGYTTIHTVPAGTCAGSGASCHNYTDLAKLHDKSYSGGTPKYQSCSDTNVTGDADPTGCHTVSDVRPDRWVADTMTCGQGTGGCHQEKTTANHGKKHALNLAASNYNNVNQTGCTNSGGGCHGTGTSIDISAYHETLLCSTSTCHTSTSKTTHHEPFTCGDCHDSTYVGAADTTALVDVNAAGHYNETTHTAASMTATVGAGGTYSATCATCHNPVSATLPDGLYAQHQGLGGGLGSTTCYDCHNKNAAISALITDTVRTNTCTPCHTAGVLPTMAQHGSTVGSAIGTETVAGACVASGCHANTDLHALHKSNVGTAGANGCTMTGCHDVNAQGVKPTSKSCGTGGACHNAGSPHPGDAAKHTALASAACVVCHESADLKLVHGDICGTCHGNATYPTLPYGKLECTSCHDGVLVGLHVYDPADPNHYTLASHESTGNGTYNGYQCSQCHKLDMKGEHSKTSVAYVTGSYAGTTTVIGKCIGCHELKVDSFSLAWDKKCASCHPATHTERATKHNASASNPACGGSGCHDITDVAVIHNESIVTNSLHPSCVTCHVNNTAVPLPIECMSAGCHAGMQHGHSLDLTNSNYNNTTVSGCTNSGIGCHGSMATSPTPDYAKAQYHPSVAATSTGCQTGSCHTSASQDATAFNNPNTCQNCHGGRVTAPLNFVNARDVSPLQSPTTSATGGHYNEATHTIVANVATMSVGGASYATCVTCHQGTNPTGGLDGEWYQHQVLQGLGNTTCYDCHSYVTSGDVAGTSRVGSLIQTSVANSRHLECKDCHNVLVMGAGFEIHETTSSPPATATVMSTPTFQCGDEGCHYNPALTVQLEIHELHKGDGKVIPYQRWDGSQYTTYTATRCTTVCHTYVAPYTMSNLTTTTACERRPEPQCVDCHDPLKQGWKPTDKSCGVNGDCHITSPHSQMGPAHSVTALSDACIECHETTDMRANHGYASDETCGGVGDNNVCHNLVGTEFKSGETTITFTLEGKKECADCHAVGKMPNVSRDHAPHDPNHYQGSETTHTAINQTGTFGAIYSVVATDGFNAVTMPASWTVVGTVGGVASPLYEGSHSARISGTGSFSRTFDVASVSSPTVEFYYQAAALDAGENGYFSYSTNGGSTWTTVSVLTNQAAWTKVGPVVVPRSTTLTVRFSCNANLPASEFFYIDGFVLKPSDAVGAGCFLSCHYNEMKPEHFKATSEATRVPGIYSDKCIDCHENRVDSFDTSKTAIDWDRTCTQCHGTSKHLGQTAKHDASAVSPTCGGSGCHYLKDVAVIHNNSSLTNTWPADPAQTCTVCHNSKDGVPATLNCNAVGCHFGVTAHEHSLDYDGSLFNTATVTGCVQSGAGCHGTLTTTNYATGYHAAVGCMTGNCHNANATNHNDPQFNDPNTCMNCHGGGASLYGGATDRLPLIGATPDGHYPEATHTAGAASRTSSITAGGTISARCNECHNNVDAVGVDGLYYQHTDINGTTADVSCPACHNYSAGVSAEITGNWTNDACSDCHNSTDMSTKVQHASVAPTVTATEYNSGVVTPGYCSAVGCHNNANLHSIHRGSASTPATRSALGCAFAGCHDYTKQGAKPTQKACGAGGNCHTTLPTHPNEATAHTTVSSGACVICHESGDLKVVHNSQCSLCHGSTKYPSLPTGKLECVSCHVTGVVGTKSYSPANPDHYIGTESTHTASAQTGAESGFSCGSCHKLDVKLEHFKSSTATPTLSGYADTCIGCHELKVDPMGTYPAWGKTCDECHATKHSALATKHNASAVGTACAGSGSGGTDILSSESFDSVTAPAWPSSWTKGGTNQVQLVTDASGNSAPNAAMFSSGANGTTQSAYFEKVFDTSTYASSEITFTYQADFPDVAKTTPNTLVSALVTKTAGWTCTDWTTYLDTNETVNIASSSTNNDIFRVDMDNPTGSGTITSVTFYAYCMSGATSQRDNIAFTVNGDSYLYGQTTAGIARNTYTLYNSGAITTVPGTSNSWTWTDVNNVRAGLKHIISGTLETINCTQLYMVVAYDEPASAAANYLKAQYSTNGGSSWTDILNTSTTTGWTTVHTSLPVNPAVLVRFSASSNQTTRIARVDDILVTGTTPAGASCHITTDVMALHNNSVIQTPVDNPSDCLSSCHVSNNAVPQTITCDAAGCHEAAHANDHVALASPDCLSCHNTSNDVQVIHAGLGDGCNVCHGGGAYTDIHSGKTPECASCHDGLSGDYVPVDPNHYTGTETSHTAGATQMGDTLDAFSLNAACSSCHDATLYSEHNAVTASKTTSPTAVCENCHISTVLTGSPTVISTNWTARNTTGACIACHAVDTKTNLHGSTNLTNKHAVTDAALKCGASGAGCHPTGNVAQVGTPSTTANIHTNCLSCHGTASRAHGALGTPGIFTGGCTSNSGYCHNSTTYTATSSNATDTHNALTGNEAIHTASAASMLSTADVTYTYGVQCGDCHSAQLGNAHKDTSTTASLGSTRTAWASTAQSTCRDCHNALSVPGTLTASAIVIKANWTSDTCTDCHTVKHNSYTAAKHTATTSGGTNCSLSTGCHGYSGTQTLDVRALHDRGGVGCSARGADNKSWDGSTTATYCHAVDKQMTPTSTTPMTCGSGAATGTKCHANHTQSNHGPDHDYNAVSAYTESIDTIGSEKGCVNSGNGCHASASTGDAVTTFHATLTAGGCYPTDACHGSSTMSAGWKAADSTANCYRCHAGGYVGAIDTSALADLAPAGHYGDTTHTASGMTTACAQGGSASATCATCHSAGFRNAHGAAGTFSSTTKGTYVTCSECHNYSAAVSKLVTDTVRTNNCALCHATAVLGATHVVHSTSSFIATATGASANCASTGIGCHNSNDLHALHKSASNCTLSGCHAQDKTMSGATTACGTAGGCHNDTNYTSIKHLGSHGLIDGADTTHTAGATQMGALANSTACSVCHAAPLNTEHARTSSSLTGTGSTTCLKCHNDSATVASVVTSSWPQKNRTDACSICHDGSSAATLHGSMATSHTATSVTGCTALGAGCHGTSATPDIPTVHNSKCNIAGCHTATFIATQKSCTGTGCHASGYNTSTYAHNAVNGTEGTHTVTLNFGTTVGYTTTGTATAACSVCHSAALATAHNSNAGYATASLGTTWTTNGVCRGCHNATSPVNVASLVTAGNWDNSCAGNNCHSATQAAHVDGGTDAIAVTGSSAAGCGATGVGCHNTYDLHALHKNSALGCGLTNCHDAANKDKSPTVKNCGDATGCHLNTAYVSGTSHNGTAGLVDGDDAGHHTDTADAGSSIGGYTLSTSCTLCHSMTLKTAHASTSLATDPSCSTGGSAGNGGCHNSTVLTGSPTQVKTSWPVKSCTVCHATSHTTYNLTTHSSGGASGCTLLATCHTSGGTGATRDFRELHDVSKGCAATGSDQKGWSGTCHALNKAMSGQAVTCGTGGACHTLHTGANHGTGGPCGNCHGATSTERLDKMVSDTTGYHHVLDAADPYVLTNNTSTSALSCTSCHNNHAFTGGKGGNLKTAVGSTTMTNTDFISTSTYGLCVSCHSSAITRGTTGQKNSPAGSANLPAVSGADFALSPHNYEINDAAKVGYGTDAFKANCIKCHDDGATGPSARQSGTYKLAPHFSADSRLTEALGAVVGADAQAEEALCYGCHTGAAAGNDYYGAHAMNAQAKGIQAQFALTGSKHNVAGYAGIHKSDEYDAAPTSLAQGAASVGWWGASKAKQHVECEDCHDIHQAQASTNVMPNDNTTLRSALPTISGANKGAWGVTVGGTGGDWGGSATVGGGAPVGPTYTKAATAAYEWQLCLKCHSYYAWGNTGAPAVPSGGMDNFGASTMTDVGKDFDPANYAYHPLFRAGLNTPATTANTNWGASGSAGRRKIGTVTDTNGLSNTFVDGWLYTSRVTCSDCHGNDDWSATASRGPHGSGEKWLLRGANTAVKVTIASGAVNNCNSNTLASSFCQNCHRSDVYGNGAGSNSATTMYSTLSRADHPGSFGSCDANTFGNPYAGCTNCHGGRPNAPGTGNKNGLIHGSSAPVGNDGGDPMGKRFCNGAAWDSHQLGQTGTVGCSTWGKSAAADPAGYSTCTQHGGAGWGKTFTAVYNY